MHSYALVLKGYRMNAAPKGVGWGTTNIPKSQWIDINKKYVTRAGVPVQLHEIKLACDDGNEATFPAKGSIQKKGQGYKPRYQIWTLDGRADLFGDHDDDLIEAGGS